MAPDPTAPAGNSAKPGTLLRRLLGGMPIFTLLMTVPQVVLVNLFDNPKNRTCQLSKEPENEAWCGF